MASARRWSHSLSQAREGKGIGQGIGHETSETISVHHCSLMSFNERRMRQSAAQRDEDLKSVRERRDRAGKQQHRPATVESSINTER